MTKRKACGFDLNGWRDFAARNWRSIPGEEEEIGSVEVIEAGPLTSVVKAGEGQTAHWIGGPQADIAPHGLGGGWGEVGREDRRVSVRSMLEGRDKNTEEFVAALTGLAQGASYNVVSIDDGPDTTEIEQERMLRSLDAGKFRNSMLVWRPVLATLHALEEGKISGEQRIGVICHSRSGLVVQKLLLRRAGGKRSDVFAPERRQPGKLIEGNIGYEKLVHTARELALGSDGLSARTAHRAQARSVGKAAMGMECYPEILRSQNGHWDMIDISSAHCLRTPLLSEDIPHLNDCSVVLVETLAEGSIRDALVEFFQDSVSCPVIELEPAAVARGALLAAKRMGDGDPVYFDFLPRISTIVFGADGARNFDLIKADETLEAGRIYRSPQPAELAIPPGQKGISVYLSKEAEGNPRKAEVLLDAPLKERSPVSLWVEQKPASGRAKIVIEARGLGRQFTIDWDEAEEDDRTWEAIIDSLESETSIPPRLILKCGLRPWEESNRSAGLFELLETEPPRRHVDWGTLAAKLSSRPFGEYCISSDGELPSEIDGQSIHRLDRLTEMALEVTRARLRGEGGAGTEDNAALRFLTWQFRRCPAEVAEWLIDCIESRSLPIFSHPFVRHPRSWKLVYQGLGRISSGETLEKRVIRLLMASKVESWVWDTESACMAFLLSRSDSAPLWLSRADIERIAKRTIADFQRNIGTEYNMFYYAPFLLAGLLRWRLKDRSALVLGIDPLGTDFLSIIERVEKDLSSRRRSSEKLKKKRKKYLPILNDLKAELAGDGGNPDLLLDIYSANSG